MSKEYNGWSNYATFRVANDLLNHHQWDDSESITVKYLRELVKNWVFENTGAVGLIVDYANLFLNNVNWEELAEVYQTDRLTQKLNLQSEHED